MIGFSFKCHKLPFTVGILLYHAVKNAESYE
jgi:hypothetical protein